MQRTQSLTEGLIHGVALAQPTPKLQGGPSDSNLPKDAIYPLNLGDQAGRPLDGVNKYALHFDKNALPPVTKPECAAEPRGLSRRRGIPGLAVALPLKENAAGHGMRALRRSPGLTRIG